MPHTCAIIQVQIGSKIDELRAAHSAIEVCSVSRANELRLGHEYVNPLPTSRLGGVHEYQPVLGFCRIIGSERVRSPNKDLQFNCAQ